MARVTVADCLLNETNRFALVRLTSRRAKQLLGGDIATTDTRGNKAIVSALREVAAGTVKFRGAEAPKEVDGADEN
ncbi:MAG: DNA-directed RNA polymerase subunit omega [Deltaproteobacteria bacterium]|nr:DNA-directed RNA polymerase subunit omega [Deltaproteobacteria bacterium]